MAMKFQPAADEPEPAGDGQEVNPAQLYRSLSDLEVWRMADIKSKGEALATSIKMLGNTREVALAVTKVEEAVMWGIRALVR